MTHDNDHIQIFKEEARDILEKIDRYFEKWLTFPSDKELLSSILRELHTLKGSARMVGLISLHESIQSLEQIFENINQDEIVITPSATRNIQSSIDYINHYIENQNLESAGDVSAESQLVEYVRIEADQLEKFSMLASQINISRRRIEQNVRKILDGVGDMMKQIALMREQTKVLEKKADANIKYSTSSLSLSKYDEFDALEMDTYSFFHQASRALVERSSQIELMVDGCVNSLKNIDLVSMDQKRLAKILEEEIMRTRLISLQKIIPRLERVVRQVSKELSKEVTLEFLKVEGEIDRRILEQLTPALEHLVRNAIDHGIGTPSARHAVGKSKRGKISLSLFKKGHDIVIEFADDGKGINLDLIKKKAVERKLWKEDVAMTQSDAIQLILLPGFSTRYVVSPISGRGIGLDVVNTEVNKLGGRLKVISTPEVGTKFIIQVPLMLSLNQALIFTIGNQYFGIPLSHLVAIKKYDTVEIESILKENKKIKHNYREYSLVCLEKILESSTCIDKRKERPVIFLRSEHHNTAFAIGQLLGSSEVVIKPLSSQLQGIKEISGVSFWGDEKIVLMLEPSVLIRQALENKSILSPASEFTEYQFKVLVVDDSVTVRRVTTRFLTKHGLKADQARNGEEALAYMAQHLPEVVLLDLEMPELDGFEVLEKMRTDPRLKNIPVIVITSRVGEKHRKRAEKLGISGYLSKPYHEEYLLRLLKEILHV